jgi:hypothetical protein
MLGISTPNGSEYMSKVQPMTISRLRGESDAFLCRNRAQATIYCTSVFFLHGSVVLCYLSGMG